MSTPSMSSLSDAWLSVLPLLTFTELLRLRDCSSSHRALFDTPDACGVLLCFNCGLSEEWLAAQLQIRQQQQPQQDGEAQAKPKGSANSKKNKNRRMKAKAAAKARREQQPQQQDVKQQEEEEEQQDSSSSSSADAAVYGFSPQLLQRLLPCLASVERLLLGHAIPPLHLALLVRSLLLCPLPLQELSVLHAPPAATQDMASWTDRFMLDQQPGLKLDFVDLPVVLWLRSPWSCPQWTAWWRAMLMRPTHRSFAVPTEEEETEAARQRQEQGDFVLRELHGRVLWFAGMRGTVNDPRGPKSTEPLAIGYLFGSVQRQADLVPSVCYTAVDECQRRMRDPQLDWSRLPIITYAIRTHRARIHRGCSVWPHLAAFLLSSGSRRFGSFYQQIGAAGLLSAQRFDVGCAARPLLIAALDDGSEERERAACEARYQQRQRQHSGGSSFTQPPTRCPHFDEMLQSMLQFSDESVMADISNEEYISAMIARWGSWMEDCL